MLNILRHGNQHETRLAMLEFLKRGERSVGEIAEFVGVTSNAVRSQLQGLEQAGWVEKTGYRPGERRPAALYRTTEQLAIDESRAYGPVLAQVIEVLGERLDSETMIQTLQAVGSRLAAAQPRPLGGRPERFKTAQAVLKALGASTDLIVDEEGWRLQGYGCPLGLLVRAESRACEAVRTLVSDIIGEALTEQCDRSGTPRCCFLAAS
jgi:predicted ArsR family transcriptional regulator